MGLYSNTRRMTTLFCATIVCVTFVMLALRLTVFSDMATAVSAAAPSPVSTPAPDSSEITGDGEFPYNLNGKIYFPKADSKGNVLILNPEGNKYLLNINIMLPETKDSLYYTGNIAPGTFIDTAKLSEAGQKLDNGIYKCVAEISAVDPETLIKVASDQKAVTVYIGERPPS